MIVHKWGGGVFRGCGDYFLLCLFCLQRYLSFSPTISISIYLSTYLSIHISIYLSREQYLEVCRLQTGSWKMELSPYLSNLPIYPSLNLSIYLGNSTWKCAGYRQAHERWSYHHIHLLIFIQISSINLSIYSGNSIWKCAGYRQAHERIKRYLQESQL